jgi:hypothetical protein
VCENQTMSVENTPERVVITLVAVVGVKSYSACRNHTRSCCNHIRACHNHTRECNNHTHTSQNHIPRVEITLVRVEITVSGEITQCVYKSHSCVSLSHS